MTKPFRFIDSPDDLNTFCEQIRQADWLALDTEFLREKTYYPQLCLLQISDGIHTACIDPLKLTSLDPLLDILYDENIVKVLHAARQDMEIFYYLKGSLPSPLFDTQIAAPLLGYADQIGYGNLVAEILNIKLEKGHARADWTRRPLPQRQLEYAADDVIYLAKLYPLLLDKLQTKKRLDWLKEDFQQLSDPSLYHTEPKNAWRRMRGTHRLKPDQLAIVQGLTAWREQTAQKENRPRNWICKDDVIIDLARIQPHSAKELSHIRGIADNTINRYGKLLLELIEQGKQEKPETVPDFTPNEKASAEQSAVIDVLMALVSQRAAEESLHPSVLSSRKNIEKLVMGETDLPVFHGWRKQLIGAPLKAMLAGELTLSVAGGRLQISEK